MPKVSVIIPVYNVEKYLKKCLDSVVQQTLEDIEIICVNDGSTDSSATILNEYAINDKRIKVLHKENSGYGHAMNVGIELAKGDYIAIVESDDWIKKDMLEALYHVAFNKQLDFVKADFYEFVENKDGSLSLDYIKLSEINNYYNCILSPSDVMEVFRLRKYTWSGIYNRTFLRNNKILHNETPGAAYQDNGFWFQTFVCAKKIMFLNRPFYMYRQDNPNSSIHSKEKVYAVANEFDFIRKFLDSLGEEGKKFIYFYSYFRFINCLGNIARIDDQYKLEFINKTRGDYLSALEANEIDENLFSQSSLKKLHEIAKDPNAYYLKLVEDKKAILTLLNKYEKIIIYGAGIYGKAVFNKIKALDGMDQILCFAVTSLEENEKHIRGIQVKCIEDLTNYTSDTLVILSVKKDTKYCNEMVANLHRLCFKNFVYLDSILLDL